MNNLTFEDLINKIGEYNPTAIDKIIKAYNYAEDLHSGQYRQSGEPYIIHPINVAYTLAELHADSDTVCAGLLHDVIEDTKTTKYDIEKYFNKDIAELVDGVTKLSKMNFNNKQEQNMANTRKIITSIMSDVRIIIIKLADRLHNMRTLEFKKPEKQIENALETINIFVPLANYIGAYRIKTELEDISLSYIKPDKYKEIQEEKEQIEEASKESLKQMLYTIKGILIGKDIPHEIKYRTKNIYGIYERKEKGLKLSDIHDLLVFKIMVDKIDDCYRTLGVVHSQYNPVNGYFKDYLYNPKKNMYKSLHTTVFAPDKSLVQAQIRTFDMDKVASFGLTSYWDIHKGNARNVMQKELSEEFQFYKSLRQIDKKFGDNAEFVKQAKQELFSDRVYVYSQTGEIIELPKGATPIDFAYAVHTDLGNTMIESIVNDQQVPFEYELQNDDRVIISADKNALGPTDDWLNKVVTAKAKRRIEEKLGRTSK